MQDLGDLTLYYHPLSSFCMKALIGLYELGAPFRKHLVDLANEEERAKFLEVWPLGKFPVLRDERSGLTIPESTTVIDYVDARMSSVSSLVPGDVDAARDCRLRDRFFDLYVNTTMGKIVTDNLRPPGMRDPFGVEQAKSQLKTAYAIANEWLLMGPWATGDTFTLADCAAAPALFYAQKVLPFQDIAPHLHAYYIRLTERPSFARVLEEAKPYLSMFPG